MATDITKSTYYASKKDAIAKVHSILSKEVGYLEKKDDTAKYLDDKTANAGYNNYTKYWRDLSNWGLTWFGAGGPDWSWCAGLQTWAFLNAFGKDLTKKMLLHLPYISCYTLGKMAGEKNRLSATPEVGSIVLFYSKSANYHHTGFVYKVDSTYFYTIEGNTSATTAYVVANGGCVAEKKYSISGAKAAGHKFFMPDYSLAVKSSGTDTAKKEDAPAAPSTTKTETATSTTTEKQTTTSTKTYYTVNTKADPLNCRNGASKYCAILGKFAKGTKVELVAKTNASWYKVTGKDTTGKTITGWCSAEFLKEVTSNTTKTTTASKEYYIINTKTDPLRCRKTASTNGTIIGMFAKGTKVEVLEKTNNSWYKVTGKSTEGKTITGYCAVSYLKKA